MGKSGEDSGNQNTGMIIDSKDSGHGISYGKKESAKVDYTSLMLFNSEELVYIFFHLLYNHEKLRLKMMDILIEWWTFQYSPALRLQHNPSGCFYPSS